jgi:NACHT domain-containing protein
LPNAVYAPFNAYDKQDKQICLHNTRVDLLQQVYNWVDGQDERCIFWLKGWAGTGKSTIARTMARKYFTEQRLGASFFFSRGGGDVGHADKFATSIAKQLANNIPTARQYICDAITKGNDIPNQSLRDQWHQLVLGPLSKLDGNGCPDPYVLVIDALDECDKDNNIQIILNLLADARSLETVRLRIFLTSRPEIQIRYVFGQIPDTEYKNIVLHNISQSTIEHDIYVFLESKLGEIQRKHELCEDWPGNEAITRLVLKAAGLFIWAATACRFIDEGGSLISPDRLSNILQGDSSNTKPEKELNEIYTKVLNNSVGAGLEQREKDKAYELLRETLGAIVALYSPLSTPSLAKLLHIPEQKVRGVLGGLHSILDVPQDSIHLLRLHHPSFRDFLLSRERCEDRNFWVDEKKAHQELADHCMRLMSTSLKQYMCGVEAPGILVTDIETSQIEQSLPAEIQYACLYWVQHIQKSGTQVLDDDQVHCFLQKHLLHWLEALAWMGKVSAAIYAVTSLEAIASVGKILIL